MERGNFMSAGIGKRRHLTEAGFVVMWSSGFIGARLGTPEAGTPTLMVWRFLLAAGLLLVGILLLRRRWPGLREIAVQGVVGVTRPGRLPDGCGRGGGVRGHRWHHGPHRGPPTPPGRGPRWPRFGRARRQAAVGRTGRWPRRGRAGGWRRCTGCRGAAVGLRHALCRDGWPGGGHASRAKGESPRERKRGAHGRGAWDPVRRQRPVVRCAGTVLGWAGAGRRVALLGCCRLVRGLLHLWRLRLLLAEPEVEQRGQGEQPHLPHTPNHHGLGLPDVRRACRSARRCRARDLLWRRPVGERLARGYQNVLMSPILVKERGRPSDCSAGCPALVGWLD